MKQSSGVDSTSTQLVDDNLALCSRRQALLSATGLALAAAAPSPAQAFEWFGSEAARRVGHHRSIAMRGLHAPMGCRMLRECAWIFAACCVAACCVHQQVLRPDDVTPEQAVVVLLDARSVLREIQVCDASWMVVPFCCMTREHS
jgi:hypothetical protein